MNVRKLIEILKKCNQDANVQVIYDDDYRTAEEVFEESKTVTVFKNEKIDPQTVYTVTITK